MDAGFRSYNLEPLLQALKRFGFAPAHIIDVGANKGDWTRNAIKFFPDAHYTLMEPQDNLKTHIEDLIEAGHKIRWINAGAGDKSGSRPFTISPHDDRSTFTLSKEEAAAEGLRQVIMEVKTLNDVVSMGIEPVPDMVKIDAEGLDLRVLEGGSELFGKTDVFVLEAAVCARFENTVAKAMKRLSDAGYKLIDITDLNRSPKHGVLWLCELVFLREASPLLDAASSYD